jgi:hypothetical protein
VNRFGREGLPRLLPLPAAVLLLVWLSVAVGVASGASSGDAQAVVESVHFSREANREEKVCLLFGRVQVPDLMALEGDRPRIVLDIEGVDSWNGQARMETGGETILRVRSHLHADVHRLRIVLDLAPGGDYLATPTFYQAEKIYCLTVRQKGGAAPDGLSSRK